jgi:hypothetical protein
LGLARILIRSGPVPARALTDLNRLRKWAEWF